MTNYSVQPRDQIFVEGYGFLSKNMVDRNNIVRNFLITLNNLLQMPLKLFQKE